MSDETTQRTIKVLARAKSLFYHGELPRTPWAWNELSDATKAYWVDEADLAFGAIDV